jgi:hypothetical protein
LFVSTIEYVTVLPVTNVPETVFVAVYGPGACTVVVAVAVSLPALVSFDAAVRVAVLVITVPAAVPPLTLTVSVTVSVPSGWLLSVQLTVPVAPTAGAVHDQPGSVETETNVVFAGIASDTFEFVAELGPLLMALMV